MYRVLSNSHPNDECDDDDADISIETTRHFTAVQESGWIIQEEVVIIECIIILILCWW